MRRIAFRRLLPIVQVALALLLIQFVEAERNKPTYVSPDTEGGWELRTDYYQPTFTETVLLALYAPALLAAVVPLLIWHPGADEWLFHVIAACCVAAQWYLVGRAIDRRLADLALASPPSSTLRILTWLSLVVSVMLALLFFFAYFAGWSPLFSAELWLGFWFAIAARLQWKKIAEWRALARAAPAAAFSHRLFV